MMKNFKKPLKCLLTIFFIGATTLSHALSQSITLISEAKVLAIPVIENHEPLIDLKNQHVIQYGPSPEIPNNTDYTRLRRAVYDKLVHAQTLLPKGMYFRVYEGYRSLSLQKFIFDARFKIVKNLHPEWTHAAVFTEATKLVAPVVNLDGSSNVPPHSTGGAIDVYLIDDNHKPLDMGIHPEDWMSDKDGALSLTASPIISTEAQKNRRIMNHALSAVGFVNYPTEYWHWSYGDRYWAFNTHHAAAIYDILPTNNL